MRSLNILSRDLGVIVRWVVVCAMLPAATFPAPALAAPRCEQIWESSREDLPSKVSQFSYRDYEELGKLTLASYFPRGVRTVRVGANEQTVVEHDMSKRELFEQDFRTLNQLRERFEGFRARPFEQWLQKKYGASAPGATSIVEFMMSDVATVEGSTPRFASLRELQDFQFYVFLTESNEPGLSLPQRFRKALAPRAVGRAMGTISKSIGMAILSVTLFTAGNQIIANGASPILSPVNDTAKMLGSNYLATPAQWFQKISVIIQAHTTGGVKDSPKAAEVITAAKELKSTDFNSLSPVERERRWSELYRVVSQRVDQAFPPFIKTGRDVLNQWGIIEPMIIAGSITGFENNYMAHQAALVTLKNTAAGRALTPEEQAELQFHTTGMRTAEDRIAYGLASWKIHQIMFKEVSDIEGKDVIGSSAEILDKSFSNFITNMNFTLFAQRFADDLQRIVGSSDISLEQLAKLKSPPQPAPAPNGRP